MTRSFLPRKSNLTFHWSHTSVSHLFSVFSFWSKSLSPELEAAAAAVADSLPFDKQTTKSELLRQLRQHEEDWKAHKDGEKPKIRLVSQIVVPVALIPPGGWLHSVRAEQYT